MKTHDGQTFHGQTLWYLWSDIGGGKSHVEVCHFPTIDTEGFIWSKCPRTGAKVSYGKVADHFSSLQAAGKFVIHCLEARKVMLEVEIAKWQNVIEPYHPPSSPFNTHRPYGCHHVKKHFGLLSLDPYEVAWRQWFDDHHWGFHGYCYLYYPEYVRKAWAQRDAPTYAEGI